MLAGLQREDLYRRHGALSDRHRRLCRLYPAGDHTVGTLGDLHRSYGHTYLTLNQPAIAPVGQCLPNTEIFRRLAVALGYDDACFSESDEEILRTLIEKQNHATYEGITWERLLRDGYARPQSTRAASAFCAGQLSHVQRKM